MEFERFRQLVALDGVGQIVVPYLSPFVYAAGALPPPSLADILASNLLAYVGLGVFYLASANVRRPLKESLGLRRGASERASTPSIRYLTLFRASLALLIVSGSWQGTALLGGGPLWVAWPTAIYGGVGLAGAGAAAALWAVLERDKESFRVSFLTPEFV